MCLALYVLHCVDLPVAESEPRRANAIDTAFQGKRLWRVGREARAAATVGPVSIRQALSDAIQEATL